MTKTQKALKFATEKHKGQVRLGGDPFISHLIEVAAILYEHHYRDDNILAAAYLHDVLEDTDTTAEELEKEFGKEITEIVVALTIKRNLGETSMDKTKRMAMQLRKAPIEAKLIKLADRLHNVRTMYVVWPKWKIERYKKATLILLGELIYVDYLLFREILTEIEER